MKITVMIVWLISRTKYANHTFCGVLQHIAPYHATKYRTPTFNITGIGDLNLKVEATRIISTF